MRVLFFCYVANDGGISNKTLELAKSLADADNPVRAVFFKQPPSSFLLTKIDHRVYKRVNPMTLPKEVREFSPALVVLAYSSYLGLSAKLRGLGVPVVPIIHGQGVRFYNHAPAKRKLLRKMASNVLRTFPAVIVLNKDLEREMLELGVKKERIYILPNGVDLDNFKPLRSSSEYDLVFSGSLYREKRLDVLFTALGAVKRRTGRHPSLLVLGTGPMMNDWKDLAKKMKLRVKFAGWKKDVWNHYPKAEILVLSSDSEEFPSAPLEAMACGLPVISTRVGSMSALLGKGRCGLTVGVNDPEGLADAIVQMLKNKKMRREMGDNGREMVEKKYGWNRVAKRYLKVFRSVVD